MFVHRWREAAAELLGVALTVALALAVGFVVVWLTSDDPVAAYRQLLTGAVSSRYRFGNFLERAVPLLLTGLSVAVSFRVRVFNIGAEGQLYAGALAGALVGLFVTLPPGLHPAAGLAAGALGGALFALVPAYLRAHWRANEVVLTLMFNYVAVLGTSYLLAGVLRDPTSGYIQTQPVQPSAVLPAIFPPSRLHAGLIVALALAVVLWWYLFRTSRGYALRMVGLNPEFAAYGGISTAGAVMEAMLVSGALAGLAGAVEVLGIHHRLIGGFSPGYGYTGIVVALLARNHPLAVVPAALLYAYLEAGAVIMERTSDVSQELVTLVQGVLFLLVTASALLAPIRRRLLREGTGLGRAA